MKTTKYNDNWKFWNEGDAFALVWNVPEHAQDVTLPHDAMIACDAYAESGNGGNSGYRDGGNYNYVKTIHPTVEMKDKVLSLKFEGVYMNAFVYVNEQLAGKSPFGYTTFYVELNDYLRYGEDNEIRVVVKNGAMTNSRWYSGSGIYRDVYLLESDLTHIGPEGVFVQTEVIEEDYAVVVVQTEVVNRSHRKVNQSLVTSILSPEGDVVGCETTQVVLPGNTIRTISQRIVVDGPSCWSDLTPDMYESQSKLMCGTDVVDEASNAFGIRDLSLDSRNGLRVNGKTVKLRGACIHHDSGLLGAATYQDAQYRQVKRLKDAGFNAIRMAHQPMAPAMLKACDTLGVYVMDETFDMWTRCKSDFDYGMVFDEWWEKDVTAMVKKDRNHPSVIMYSIGNEIPEVGTDAGMMIADQIVSKIKSLDPTRYTLSSVNGVFASGDRVDEIVEDVVATLKAEGKIEGNVNHFMALMQDHMDTIVVHPIIGERLENASASVDIAGYNYMTARYEADGETYPNRVIVGSETYPPAIVKNWDLVEKLPHVIGDFTWTGWDYIGEAGVGIPAYNFGEGGFGAKFPCQLAYCGDFDLIGSRRPASYYREIAFGIRNKPYISVQDPNRYGQHLMRTPWIISDSVRSWQWDGFESKPVLVEVYSPGDEVALMLNGEEIGREAVNENRINTFDTSYMAGTLEAISYENGVEIGRDLLTTPNKGMVINAEVEKGNEGELIFVNIELTDDDGTLLPVESGIMSVEAPECILMGLGSGDPKPKENYTGTEAHVFNGKALAIFKGDAAGEKIRLVYGDVVVDVVL